MSPHVPADEVRPLDLEQQKKRAKELRRDLAAGQAEALGRFRRHHPKSEGLADAEVVGRLAKVTEAQLVIARELGLPSWPRLARHITRYAAARAAVARGGRVLDGDPPTVHVRCGSDIRGSLERAGAAGDFVEFADPYCQGPVPNDGDLLETRARFIAMAYQVPLDDARATLRRSERDLEATLTRERVVLWFEHDSFDQLILARLLAFYRERGVPRRLELVSIDRFPAVDGFKGLGELSATALRMLWDDRVPVTADQLELGSEVWNALRRPSPMTLFRLASTAGPLPLLGGAVLRHLAELPWRENGLSLTQRLTLELVGAEPATAGEIFVRLTNEREPLPHLGDSMWWAVVREMSQAGIAPFEVRDGVAGAPWHQHRLVITDAGRRILSSDLDWLACAPPERWVGGVRIAPGSPDWRWDGTAGEPRLGSGFGGRT